VSDPPLLSDDDRRALLEIAVTAIAEALRTGQRWAPPVPGLPAVLAAPGACFVTLRRDGRLLGCVGSLEARQPLAVDVATRACHAAFDDPRMPPIDDEDFRLMSVDVSVLGPTEELPARSPTEVVAAVRPCVDGLLLDGPGFRGTLLPSVWRQIPTPAAFVDALWRKAGLPPGSWLPGMRVLRYRVDEFADPGPRNW